MTRRVKSVLVASAAVAIGAAALVAVQDRPARAAGPEITVYKTPWCGCCGAWVDHLEENDFDVTVRETEELNPVKARHHVPARLGSCHTAVVNGYVIEGHVPADLIKRFVEEAPRDFIGLAVPGMPTGSPGMEGPNPEPYEVLAFDRDGKTQVYATR